MTLSLHLFLIYLPAVSQVIKGNFITTWLFLQVPLCKAAAKL